MLRSSMAVLPYILLFLLDWVSLAIYKRIFPELHTSAFPIEWMYLGLTVLIGLYYQIPLIRRRSKMKRGFRAILESILLILICWKVLAFVNVLIVEVAFQISKLIVSDPGAIQRSQLLAIILFGIATMLGAMLIYGMLMNPYRYRIHRIKVKLPQLPDALQGLRIVQISDIHSGTFLAHEPIRKGIEKINDLDPDLVMFTGDLVNRKTDEVELLIPILSEIRATYGIFSILGNHDYGDYYRWPSHEAKRDNFRSMIEAHHRLGWDLLRNEHRLLEINGSKLLIVGVENYSTHRHFPKYGDLSKALQGTSSAVPTILLSHDPTHWSAQVKEVAPQIDLTLSGHTHGFQFGVEIPGLIKWSPVKYVYKQWAGLYKHENQYLYVNRGFGMLGYPGRVGILPEITLLELI